MIRKDGKSIKITPFEGKMFQDGYSFMENVKKDSQAHKEFLSDENISVFEEAYDMFGDRIQNSVSVYVKP